MNYDECIDFIKGVEAYDTLDRVITADVYELGKEIEIKQYDDRKVGAIIASIETMEGGVVAQMPTAAQINAPNMGEVGARIKSLQESGTKRAMKEMEMAAGELGTLVSSAEKKFTGRIKKSDDKLIMVHLSMQDQISELEKISLGLDGNSFDQNQLAIIRTEVSGLLANRPKPKDDFQKSLATIRDARLAEVAKKLGL